MPSRRVLITGASRGIGRAVADRLAEGGHEPIGLARSALEDFPGEFYEVDLADPYATAATLDKIVGHAAVHAVVNNVGFPEARAIGFRSRVGRSGMHRRTRLRTPWVGCRRGSCAGGWCCASGPN